MRAIFAFRQAADGSCSFPFVSPIVEELFGLSREDLAQDASSILQFIRAEDMGRVLDSIAQSAATLAEWQCEFKMEWPNTGPMRLEGRALPRRSDEGAVTWYGYLEKVPERRQSERATLESQQRFHAYIENAPITIMVVEQDGRIAECNPAGLQMLGYDRTALGTLTVFDLHAPDERDVVRSRLQELARSGRVDSEVQLVRRDGTIIWVLLRAVMLDPTRSIGFCQDITHRKDEEAEVLRARQLLEAFIAHAPVGIAMFNRNMRYIRSSRLWQALFNTTEETLVGRSHYEDLCDLSPKWIAAHQRGLAGETVKGEDQWVRPDGKGVSHRWEVHPWGDAGEDTGGIIILFEDVTEARAMEAELRHAHKMEALGQLAGGVAHDFNNLLQIIFGYTEMVQQQTAGDCEISKFTNEVLRATRRASSLTRQLLAFSRRQVFTPAVLDLNAVISSTSKMLRRLLGENIIFEMLLEEPLWPVEADGDQLSQVLINLCVNARDAMPNGGRLKVSTSSRRAADLRPAGPIHLPPGECVVMTVDDNGTGMEPEVLQHIFEPFFTTKEAGKGTGLGLSTVYGIVQQSNGHVWVDSFPGQGTRFTVCLPRTSRTVAVSPSGSNILSPGGGQTLLIVEDDEDVRKAIAGYLPSLGYKVLTSHPENAVDLARLHAGDLDLLITDVVMPGVSGPELAQIVRVLRPGLPILFMSGYIDDAVTRHGVLESKAPFLQKPFTLAELAAAIREALDRR
jgi:two-component system, cell cycle sensor histidine kinase and response regulator CckA